MPRGVRKKLANKPSARNASINGDVAARARAEGDGDQRIRAEREALLTAKQRELEELIGTHDGLTRELFHLEKFVSLTYFDPKVAQNDRSAVFLQWKERYDLMSKSTSESVSARQTRRAQNERLSTLTHAPQSAVASSSKVTIDAVRSRRSNLPTSSTRQASTSADPCIAVAAEAIKNFKRQFGKGKQKESISDEDASPDATQTVGLGRKRRKLLDDDSGVLSRSNIHSTPTRLLELSKPNRSASVEKKKYNRWKDAPITTNKEMVSFETFQDRVAAMRGMRKPIPFTLEPATPSRAVITVPLRSLTKPTETPVRPSAEISPLETFRDKLAARVAAMKGLRNPIPSTPVPSRAVFAAPPKSKASETPVRPSVGGKTVAGKTVAAVNSNATPSSLQRKPSIKRVKLLVREPPPLISRPEQRLPTPRFGKSLPSLLSSYIWFDDREHDSSSIEKLVVKEARIRNKVSALKKSGRLALDAESALALRDKFDRDRRAVPAAFKERERSSDIWASIVHSVTHQKHSKAWTGKQICSSIASKIRLYWENQASKEGKARVVEEKRLRVLAKSTLKLVNNEWKKAIYFVREQNRLLLEAEQKRIGSQHLDAILTQSGQILEAQHHNLLRSGISRRLSETGSISGDTESGSDDPQSDNSDVEDTEVDDDDDAGEESDEEFSEHEDVDLSVLLDLPKRRAPSDVDSVPEGASHLSGLRSEIGEEEHEEEEEEEEEIPVAGESDNDDVEELLFMKEKDSLSAGDISDHISLPDVNDVALDERLVILDKQKDEIAPKPDEFVDIVPLQVFAKDGKQQDMKLLPPKMDLIPRSPVSLDHSGATTPCEGEEDAGQADKGSSPRDGTVDTPRPRIVLVDSIRKSQKLLSSESIENAWKSSTNVEEISSRNQTLDSGIDITEDNHGNDENLERLDDPVSHGVNGGTLHGEQHHAKMDEEPTVRAKSPASIADMAESDGNSETDAPWEVPCNLQPFAVARVNWRPVDKLKPPLLLRGTLRPYQQSGLEWLATLHQKEMNGILADEMGLGKTIQTISMLAHLACDRGIWGPHLIIVPTSVLLNWEMEFKKFLPGFKILGYHGTTKRRKELRQGWNSKYAFNVCVTSYSLASRDAHIFRRKAWYYMILDEAHMIKNFKSQRWNTLLLFKSMRRLLLTGTPLQNNLTELWALLKFLMSGTEFANLKEFGDWFSNPLEKAIEQGNVLDQEVQQRVSKLHTVLRPYLLRRLKRDVEKELPQKYEHLVLCRLSKRQRFLYDEFMARADTRNDLNSGQYHRIANILMQLRKVCNHPDLFEVRPIVTSFAMPRAAIADFETKELLIRRRFLEDYDASSEINLDSLNLKFMSYADRSKVAFIGAQSLREDLSAQELSRDVGEPPPAYDTRTIIGFRRYMEYRRRNAERERLLHLSYLNSLRCGRAPAIGLETIKLLGRLYRPLICHEEGSHGCEAVQTMVASYQKRSDDMAPIVEKFTFATPSVIAMDMPDIALRGAQQSVQENCEVGFDDVLHRSAVKLQIAFPDRSLLQYDCGKLQELARLLRERHAGGHRVLIFTQMTKILDVLEIFLNHHGYLYLRLDGATKLEDRQYITERFNVDVRVFAFIASSRSGGVGINLTGADTVIFYDSDFNPQMDRQCEDRAHRIGQMRDVHIYRFISQYTVEEAMLRKANQKRHLDNIVIQQGEFDWRTFFGSGEEEGGEQTSSTALQRALVEFEDFEDAHAAKVAASEEAALQGEDQQDFQDLDLPTTAAFREGFVATPISEVSPANEAVVDADNEAMDEPEEDEGGTIVDYMVSFVKFDPSYFSDWKM